MTAGVGLPPAPGAESLAALLRAERREILSRWRFRLLEATDANDSPARPPYELLPCLFDRLADTVDAMARGAWKLAPLDPAELRRLARLGEASDVAQILDWLGVLRRCVLEIASRRPPEPRPDEVDLVGRAHEATVRWVVDAHCLLCGRLRRALDQLSAVALRSSPLDEVLPQLLRVALESALDVDTAALLVAEGDALRLRAAVGLEADAVARGFRLEVPEGFARWVAGAGAPRALEGAADDPLVKSDVIRRRGIRALLGAPLVENGDLLGILYMGSLSVAEFTEQDRRLLGAIADHTKTAMLAEKVRDGAARAADRTARVQAITSAFMATLSIPEVARVIVTQGLPLLDASACNISLVSGDDLEVITAGFGEHGGLQQELLVAWQRYRWDVPVPNTDAFRNREAVWIESEAEFVDRYPAFASLPRDMSQSAWAALPLLCEGRPIGVLGLSFAHPRRFRADEKAFALELAQLCAQALERARLHQEVEAARARAEELLHSRNEALAVLDGVYDTAPVGLAFLDRDLRYVRINDALAAMNGLPPAAHLGRQISEIFPEQPAVLREVEAQLRRVLETGEAQLDLEAAGETRAAPGARRSWLNSFYPVRARGEIVGVGVLVREITAEKQAEQERAELLRREQVARGEAQAATSAKDHFLAVLSHELRTPLQSMLGWTQMLKASGLDARMAQKGLETIERNVMVQQQLIEDLLDVSRIVAGKLRLARQRIDLASVVEAALATAKVAADAKSLRLEAAIEPGPGEVLGDPDRLQQVVSNLLTNAVKFTPRLGWIGVRVERAGAAAKIRVEDSGRGIAAKVLPHVFDRFRQAESTTTRTQGGLGLGLAIVRHLVELHGGTVAAESPGEGRGATFTVTLPLASAEQGAAVVGLRKSVQLTACDPAVLAGVRLLVVDDEPDACELLEAVLQRWGADVHAVRSARAALDELASWRPHLLISDLGMPEQDGYALIQEVRARESGEARRLPAIALSAFASHDDRALAVASGFDEHVAKPASPAELVRAVARLLARSG